MAGMFVDFSVKNTINTFKRVINKLIIDKKIDFILNHKEFFINDNRKLYLQIELEVNEEKYILYLLSNGVPLQEEIFTTYYFQNLASIKGAKIRVVINKRIFDCLV